LSIGLSSCPAKPLPGGLLTALANETSLLKAGLLPEMATAGWLVLASGEDFVAQSEFIRSGREPEKALYAAILANIAWELLEIQWQVLRQLFVFRLL
jgi:hypothetical protein